MVSTYNLVINNSEAIVTGNNLAIDNSWAILAIDELSVDNSTAITGWIADTSNVMVSTYNLVVNNSEAIVTGNNLAIDNSWAILNIDERVVDNSWAIENLDERVIDNSWAIVNIDERIVDNSWAIENLDERIINNSWAIVSNNELAVDNSTAITGWIQDTSNVMISTYDLVVNNSEAIVTGNNLAIENSWAILNIDERVVDNSWAIENLDERIVDNSWAIVANNDLAVANSTAITGWVQDTSNAVFNFVLHNSQAIVTISELNLANSYAIIAIDELTDANSWAVVSVRELSVANSDALIANQTLDIQTSNAVVTLADGLGTIDHGPAHIHMTSNTTMSFDTYTSPDHQLQIHSSGFLDGAGHAIKFGRSGTVMTVDAAVTVTLQNVVLEDFSDDRISLGVGSDLIFGQNVTVELAGKQTLSRPWTVAGYTIIKGQAEELELGTGDNYIVVLPNAGLTLKDVMITNVGFNNLRCMGDASGLTFENAHLQLGPDFTFSSGSLTFVGDTHISGTTTFNYATGVVSTIESGAGLYLDLGSKFNYAPSIASKTLFVMTDSTSRLHLTGATLSASTTGCQLTKGKVIIDGLSEIESSATVLAEAIVFGDGTPTNDLIIEVLPGAGLDVTSGYLHYNNAN